MHNDTILVRRETQADFPAVFKLTEQAFATLEVSDHTEQFLVERLRNSPAFVPELSLVAVINTTVVGHILLTRIQIGDNKENQSSLVLAPVSVLPEFQKQGIGGKLINAAHAKAKELGFTSVILVGHAEYYPRFGYKKLSSYGITLPFPVPDECCLGAELTEGALSKVSGIVIFPPEFGEH